MICTTRNASIRLLTFREGLLSRLGHDLQLTLEEFSLTIDPETGEVQGRFFPARLVVDGSVERGVVRPDGLKARDKAQIARNVQRDVLHVTRYPHITFEGALSDDGAWVKGALTMVGQSHPIEVPFERRGGRLQGEVSLTPSRWGIPPYTALLGGIRLQDRVILRFDLPDPG
ncbi:MAG: YceI family protein [Bradymonadia bacterium]